MFSRFAVAMKFRDAVTPEELADIFRNAYNPSPEIVFLRSVANISDTLDPTMAREMTSNPRHDGLTSYRQFKLCTQDSIPVVQVRKLARGDEIFRGLDPQTMSTPLFQSWSSGLQWQDVGPAQAKETSHDDILQYRKTIRNADLQWGLTAAQKNRLTQCVEVLESTEPLPFHWVEQNLLLMERPERQHTNGGPIVTIPDPESDEPEEDVSETGLVALEPVTANPWDPQHVAEMAMTPLLPFHMFDLVVCNSGQDEDSDDPFYLAMIISVDNPPHWQDVDGATENDRLVKVHWWDKKSGASWKTARYKPLLDRDNKPLVQWTTVSCFYFSLVNGLTQRGKRIRKQDPDDQRSIEFYLKHPELAQQQPAGAAGPTP
jgi:hypothetical protein